MSITDRSEEPRSPDDSLPPVEPPSAGFILQLFVVPGVIVVIIVMVWLMFNWLAQMGNDPRAYVEALRRDNAARWQAAVNLANALRDERSRELRYDSRLADELAAILQAEIDSGSMQEHPITLRVFLCRALGEFKVPDGLPVLLTAVATDRDEKEAAVRRAASEAIAVLTENLHDADPPATLKHPELEKSLLDTSNDANPLVRSAAAYAMGVVGGEALLGRLERMLEDPYPDARYNAATGLARHGSMAAAEVLVEMLDPDQLAVSVASEAEGARGFKQAMIAVNSLRAIRVLAKQNSDAATVPFVQAIDKLLGAEIEPEIRVEAIAARKHLTDRSTEHDGS